MDTAKYKLILFGVCMCVTVLIFFFPHNYLFKYINAKTHHQVRLRVNISYHVLKGKSRNSEKVKNVLGSHDVESLSQEKNHLFPSRKYIYKKNTINFDSPGERKKIYS